ncbi:MAG: flavodoxin [Ruthenibacterium sp.]
MEQHAIWKGFGHVGLRAALFSAARRQVPGAPAASSKPPAEESTPFPADQAYPGTPGGKTLVVHYSATGNTEQAANYIAQVTGGDLFALEPVEPYTTEDLNYSNEDSRVSYEHENPDARQVELTASTVENWEEYDTIFLGYPNWWGDMPQALYTFLEEYDFSGKTIIPFCPHGGSGFSRTISTIAELQPGANVMEQGLSISRNSVTDAQSDVENWVAGLGF